jgi:hypothetical protein
LSMSVPWQLHSLDTSVTVTDNSKPVKKLFSCKRTPQDGQMHSSGRAMVFEES